MRFFIIGLLAVRAWGVVSCSTNKATGSTYNPSFSVAFPAANTAHDLLIANVFLEPATATATVSGSVNGAYTQAVSNPSSLTGTNLYTFYIKDAAAGTDNVTILGVGTTQMYVSLMECSGTDNSAPLDVVGSGAGYAGTPVGPGITTTSNGDLVVGFGFIANAAFSAGPGFMQLNSTGAFVDEWQAQANVGNIAVQFSNSSPNNGTWDIVATSFRAGGLSIENKRLLTLSPTNMPSFCAGMVTADCNGYTSGNMVSFACLYADGSCGGLSIPVNRLGGLFGNVPLTVDGAVSIGQHICIVGANLGSAVASMGALGSISPMEFAFSCTP